MSSHETLTSPLRRALSSVLSVPIAFGQSEEHFSSAVGRTQNNNNNNNNNHSPRGVSNGSGRGDYHLYDSFEGGDLSARGRIGGKPTSHQHFPIDDAHHRHQSGTAFQLQGLGQQEVDDDEDSYRYDGDDGEQQWAGDGHDFSIGGEFLALSGGRGARQLHKGSMSGAGSSSSNGSSSNSSNSSNSSGGVLVVPTVVAGSLNLSPAAIEMIRKTTSSSNNYNSQNVLVPGGAAAGGYSINSSFGEMTHASIDNNNNSNNVTSSTSIPQHHHHQQQQQRAQMSTRHWGWYSGNRRSTSPSSLTTPSAAAATTTTTVPRNRSKPPSRSHAAGSSGSRSIPFSSSSEHHKRALVLQALQTPVCIPPILAQKNVPTLGLPIIVSSRGANRALGTSPSSSSGVATATGTTTTSSSSSSSPFSSTTTITTRIIGFRPRSSSFASPPSEREESLISQYRIGISMKKLALAAAKTQAKQSAKISTLAALILFQLILVLGYSFFRGVGCAVLRWQCLEKPFQGHWDDVTQMAAIGGVVFASGPTITLGLIFPAILVFVSSMMTFGGLGESPFLLVSLNSAATWRPPAVYVYIAAIALVTVMIAYSLWVTTSKYDTIVTVSIIAGILTLYSSAAAVAFSANLGPAISFHPHHYMIAWHLTLLFRNREDAPSCLIRWVLLGVCVQGIAAYSPASILSDGGC